MDEKTKGFETFLKKMAFNQSGKSPSATEVKIISCIPIDVTDLQLKILELEQRLEKAKGTGGGDHYSSGSSKSDSTYSYMAQVTPGFNYKQSKLLPMLDTIDDMEQAEYVKEDRRTSHYNEDRYTHLVYRAQTTDSPFTRYNKTKTKVENGKPSMTSLPHSYHKKISNKKHRSRPVTDLSSYSSQFSVPICRDDYESAEVLRPRDSDLCTCCESGFREVGQKHARPLPNDQQFIVAPIKEAYSKLAEHDKSIYYDSNMYDVVPTKETSTKKDYNDESCQRSKRSRHKQGKYYSKKTVPNQSYNLNDQVLHNKRKRAARLVHKREYPHDTNSMRKQRERVPSTCSVDHEIENYCMKSVYTKPSLKKHASQKRNSKYFTPNLNNVECQSTSSRTQSDQNSLSIARENKTEETLNQIKAILKSVLTEVKMKTSAENTKDSDEQMKEACVQTNTENNLQSDNYCNPHPSKHLPMQFMSSKSQLLKQHRCLHSYPFSTIHTPTLQYAYSRTVPSRVIHPLPKPSPVSTATNTDQKQQENNDDTNILLKEIHRSLTTDLKHTNKDDLKYTTHSTEKLDSLENTEEAFEGSNKVSSSAHLVKPVKRHNEESRVGRQIESPTKKEQQLRNSRKIEKSHSREDAAPRHSTYTDDESESKSSDNETSYSDQTTSSQQSKQEKSGFHEKGGILNKVAMFFKNKNTSEKETARDSENYQESRDAEHLVGVGKIAQCRYRCSQLRNAWRGKRLEWKMDPTLCRGKTPRSPKKVKELSGRPSRRMQYKHERSPRVLKARKTART